MKDEKKEENDSSTYRKTWKNKRVRVTVIKKLRAVNSNNQMRREMEIMSSKWELGI